jgi:hypothetical protein
VAVAVVVVVVPPDAGVDAGTDGDVVAVPPPWLTPVGVEAK